MRLTPRISDWDESDIVGSWRKALARYQRAGGVKKVKRRVHRRWRREGKAEIERGAQE